LSFVNLAIHNVFPVLNFYTKITGYKFVNINYNYIIFYKKTNQKEKKTIKRINTDIFPEFSPLMGKTIEKIKNTTIFFKTFSPLMWKKRVEYVIIF